MTPSWQGNGIRLWQGDAVSVLAAMPAASVHCCMTSPPYWQLRLYYNDQRKA